MAQEMTVNIKTTSEVPQAMEKAKQATTGFGKQVEDIGKKFSTAFKDIALGFIAPMVLLNAAINFISSAIEKRKQDIKEAYDFAVRAESKYLDSETVVLAKQRSAREQDQKDRQMAQTAKLTEYTKFLEEPGMRDKIAEEIGGFRGFRIKTGIDANSAEDLAKDADVQAVIARMIAPAVAASKKAADIVAEPKSNGADFKGPEGFGNVIGVGPNPVMEAMARQIEIQEQQLAELQKLNAKDTGTPKDFTKDSK
jgi:hypothetical protein